MSSTVETADEQDSTSDTADKKDPAAESSNTEESSSASSASDSESETTPEAVPTAKYEIELTLVTEVLEYSDKEVDSTSLVKCSNENVQVEALDEIDLSTIGTQSVRYAIDYGGRKGQIPIEFTVRDTKAPIIELAEENPSIEKGGYYNPLNAVTSLRDEVDGELSFTESQPENAATSEAAEESLTAEFEAGESTSSKTGWFTIEGSVNSSVPGTYPIKVIASDKHGNIATKEFAVTVTEPVEHKYLYIANANTKTFHIDGCHAVSRMKEQNKILIEATRSEMIEWGYKPCGICHP